MFNCVCSTCQSLENDIYIKGNIFDAITLQSLSTNCIGEGEDGLENREGQGWVNLNHKCSPTERWLKYQADKRPLLTSLSTEFLKYKLKKNFFQIGTIDIGEDKYIIPILSVCQNVV